MKVTLYKNKSAPNVVDKSLSNPKDVNADFFEPDSLNVSKPKIALRFTNDADILKAYNYVYIKELKRYYYIDSVNTEGRIIVYNCRCDVLMSFKSDILSSNQYVLRQETKYHNPYLYDNLLPIRSDHNYSYKEFGVDVFSKSNARVILATTGKGGTPA